MPPAFRPSTGMAFIATPAALRQELCDQFQNDDLCRAAVLSITAAGVGLTLHAASCVIFAELFWNPGQIMQAEGTLTVSLGNMLILS